MEPNRLHITYEVSITKPKIVIASENWTSMPSSPGWPSPAILQTREMPIFPAMLFGSPIRLANFQPPCISVWSFTKNRKRKGGINIIWANFCVHEWTSERTTRNEWHHSLLSSSRTSPSPNTWSAAIDAFLSFLSSLDTRSPPTITPLPVRDRPSSSSSRVSPEYAYL